MLEIPVKIYWKTLRSIVHFMDDGTWVFGSKNMHELCTSEGQQQLRVQDFECLGPARNIRRDLNCISCLNSQVQQVEKISFWICSLFYHIIYTTILASWDMLHTCWMPLILYFFFLRHGDGMVHRIYTFVGMRQEVTEQLPIERPMKSMY